MIDPFLAGTKFMVVSGKLNLYGIVPPSVTTYLNATAFKATNTISVYDSTGWTAGDTLAIAPSFSNPT